MTKTDLIAQVAANTEMSKKSAEQAVNAVFEALSKAMSEGEKITISGFGTFEMRERLFPRWCTALFALLPMSELLYLPADGQSVYAAALASC